jgi:lipocalin
MIKDLNCRCAMPEIVYETDDIENYKGKWAVLYTLDNGTTIISPKEAWKDTEQEKLDEIEDQRIRTENKNLQNLVSTLSERDGSNKVACMFNNKECKNYAKSFGMPIITSMIPIPVGE